MKKKLREEIYNKYGQHCAYCGKVLSEMKDMQVDHIVSKRNGGTDSPENLNPSCRRCNHYKRGLNIEGFRIYLSTLHERIESDYITKVAIDYGLVTIKKFDKVFYFEKYDKR